MKDRINRAIKHRESFRPFAPAILEERADDFFHCNGYRSPFMLFCFEVRDDKKAVIPAVVHVDGTSRVQTVSREQNPRFYSLIEEFGRLTGVPLLLNTSFNDMDEPIVCSPEDAVDSFLSTKVDYLVLGDCLVRRRAA